jgi:Tol biopolymer transport system component
VTGGPVSMVDGVLRATTSASANYSVSDDGTLFFFAGETSSKQRLSWVDRDGRAEGIETIPPGDYATPRLSPDGERALVVSDGDLRIYDLASGRESRLTTDGATMAYAGWTSSGDEVTYTSDRGSNGPDVWIQPADGSGAAQQLTALDGEVHFDDWAPDGHTFSAHHHGIGFTTSQMMVSFDGEEAEPEEWLQREYANESAVFSPDGRYVALVTTQTGQYEIVIHPFPGPGGQTPVSVGGGIEPAWSRNGELFYRRLGDYAMMVVEVSTDPELTVGPPKELFRGRGFPGGSPRARYAVTADGQRFLMSAGLLESVEGGVGEGGRSRVVIVQNWIEELKARVPN